MDKRSFQTKINKAEKYLKTPAGWSKGGKCVIYEYMGVCDTLCEVFVETDGFSYRDEPFARFEIFFEPKGNEEAYWLGKLNEENLERRKIALRLFEQMAIENKWYLMWKQRKRKSKK